jgi:Calcium-activated chloride channel
VSFTTLRRLMSLSLCMSFVALMLYLMLFFNAKQLAARDMFGPYDLQRYLPIVYYSLCPVIASALFGPLAKSLTSFERHLNQDEFHAYYILKVFSLQFVNRYSSLLYAAIWLQDLALVRSLLLSQLITNAVGIDILKFSSS